MVFTGCTFSLNAAQGQLGGGENGGPYDAGGLGGQARGGAIEIDANLGGLVSITNCTFSGNAVTGGDGGPGTNLSNGGSGGTVEGGTIEGGRNTQNVFLTNCTITGNHAFHAHGGTSVNGQPGPNGGAFTGGVYGYWSLNHALLAENTADSPGCVDLAWAYYNFQGDYNLIQSTGCWAFGPGQGAHNQIGVAPQLDPAGLQDNGGPTKTVALLSNSPAVDAGSSSLGSIVDQRGLIRDGAVDIGACEYNGRPFQPTIIRSDNDIIITTPVVPGRTFRLERKFSLTDPAWLGFPEAPDITPASGSSAQFTLPDAAASFSKAFYRVREVQQ